jgi:hypothetical protein
MNRRSDPERFKAHNCIEYLKPNDRKATSSRI